MAIDYGLAGKRAIVVGAGKDVGRELAIALAGEGARVVLAGRGRGPLEDTAAMIASQGGEAHVVAVDLHDPQGADSLAGHARTMLGGVDLVGNTAGVFPTSRLGPGHPSPALGIDEGWNEAFEWVLMSAVRLTRAVLPGMIEQGSGAMVHLGANSSRDYRAMTGQFGAMKAALAHVVKNWAREGGTAGVRVNAVHPGWIKGDGVTAMIADSAGKAGISLAEQERALVGNHGDHYWTPRMGLPGEYADAMLFLLSDRASYINGAMLPVDGGSRSWS
ncbi:MAG: SDR family oxidoreductase [Novosphingobium sp.]|nr:SDR family oxidoreductase [Novosphingobium sp.]